MMQRGCLALNWAVVCAATAAALAQERLHVMASASPGGDGASWETAFHDLQDALDAAAGDGGQIWVAAGTYRPDRATLDRSATFALRVGVGVYGGFAGAETELEQRDPAANVTILSGDLLGNDGPNFANTADNSFHVASAIGTDSRAILDGFTIQAGNAPNLGGPDALGGGMTVLGGSARVVNCRFVANRASFGGALYAQGASPVLIRCSFEGNAALVSAGALFAYSACQPVFIGCGFTANTANMQGGAIAASVDCFLTLANCGFYGNRALAYGGGAVLNNNSASVLLNCVFSGNASEGPVHGGGALRNEHGSAELVQCTLYGNTARAGGGIFNFNNSSASLANCVLWANQDADGTGEAAQLAGDGGTLLLSHCCVQGWTGALGGAANFGFDPVFLDPDGADNLLGTPDDDLRLDGCASPCTNTGDNAAQPADWLDLDDDGDLTESLPIDLAGQPRTYDGQVDRGAYETVGQSCPRGDLNCDGHVDFGDINPLVLALSSPQAYAATYPHCHLLRGDCNYDGTLDFADINAFVALLSGGSARTAQRQPPMPVFVTGSHR